jgi:hypothetical protein
VNTQDLVLIGGIGDDPVFLFDPIPNAVAHSDGLHLPR